MLLLLVGHFLCNISLLLIRSIRLRTNSHCKYDKHRVYGGLCFIKPNARSFARIDIPLSPNRIMSDDAVFLFSIDTFQKSYVKYIFLLMSKTATVVRTNGYWNCIIDAVVAFDFIHDSWFIKMFFFPQTHKFKSPVIVVLLFTFTQGNCKMCACFIFVTFSALDCDNLINAQYYLMHWIVTATVNKIIFS